ncbi:Arm DNA-binding domain-containing protein [Bacillus paranthracis]
MQTSFRATSYLFLKEGNSWCYEFTIEYGADGKREQKKKRGFKTEIEVQQALTEAMNAHSYVYTKKWFANWTKLLSNNMCDQTATKGPFSPNSNI